MEVVTAWTQQVKYHPSDSSWIECCQISAKKLIFLEFSCVWAEKNELQPIKFSVIWQTFVQFKIFFIFLSTPRIIFWLGGLLCWQENCNEQFATKNSYFWMRRPQATIEWPWAPTPPSHPHSQHKSFSIQNLPLNYRLMLSSSLLRVSSRFDPLDRGLTQWEVLPLTCMRGL